MWIQVRSMDGRKSVRIDGLSKLTKIEEIREKLVDDFEAPVERQKLFYRGKLMLNGYSLFDYDVTLNALIQLMVVPEKPVDKQLEDIENKKEEEISVKEEVCTADNDLSIHAESTYKLGDIIDCLDEEMGAWFEARLVKITRNTDDVSGKKLACNSSDTAETVSMETDNKDDTSDEGENKENVTLDANMNQSMTKTCGILTDSKNNCTDIKERITDDNRDTPSRDIEDDGFVYHVIFESYEDDSVVKVPVKNIRPRARHKLSLSEVQIGDRVMVNYNYDEPKCRGYWYDAVITGKRNTRTIKELTATVYIGKELVPFENCKIQFVNEVFKIEEPGTQLNINDASSSVVSPEKRLNKPECDHCLDNPAKKCKFCACTVCGDKKDPEKQVLCDECDQAYHLYCLKPPLTEIPDVDEWYCPECKTDTSEVVQAGEKLKGSKKKARMASAKSEKTRDWGKGMACVGRSKQCNIVPPNHFGPIPGIHVGQMWKYRVQVSEAGVHRPHVAGISGRENEGAYSIVLAGGYEDDVDNGDEFTYTGSGGRDLSGNKRTAEQSCDQTLTRMNKALARDCYAPLDNKNGAESKEWKKGKPIRVVRNCKGAKHSKYAPTEGNRYDGIYKVVKYWPDKGLSGYIVWRYLLRRDDPDPAPWTKEGKKRTEELGLVMEYPDGYMEKEAEKQSEKEKKEQEKVEKTPAKKKKGVKRKRVINSDSEEDSESPVRKKSVKYSIPNEVKKHIKGDVKNAKLWEEAMESVGDGVQKFLAKVEELFQCICCQELVFQPITTDCNHNICKPCLQRAFKAEVYSCPTCRAELGKNYSMNVNQSLATALNGLYPGYETGR